MNDEIARRVCQFASLWRAYVVLNLVLLGLLLVSLTTIRWSLDNGPFVIAVLALVVVVGSILVFGVMIRWCDQYRGVQTVD
jgi:protein-S-isoprenylcysteine O-methyltransferase Ste14